MNSKESSIRVVPISGPAPMTYESGLQRRAGTKAPSTHTLGGLGQGGGGNCKEESKLAF